MPTIRAAQPDAGRSRGCRGGGPLIHPARAVSDTGATMTVLDHASGLAADVDLSNPDWLSAIGQAGGTAIAAVAALIAVYVARAEARARRADQNDREAAQARQILAVFTTVEPGSGSGSAMEITNYSGEVLTMVEAVAVEARELPDGYRAQWIGSPLSDPHIARIVRPGGSFVVEYEIVWRAPSGHVDESAGPPTLPPIRFWIMTVEFTDARGLRWRRVGNGPPVRVLAARHGVQRILHRVLRRHV